MKNKKKKTWILLIILLAVLLPGTIILTLFVSSIIISKMEFRVSHAQFFKDYERACTDFSDYIYNTKKDKNIGYYIYYDSENGDTAVTVKNIADGSSFETDNIQTTNYIELRKAFSELTGGYGYPDYIWVSEDYVVYYSEGYEPELIYSVHGGIDPEQRKVEEKYRQFYKINDNWYAIRINLL